MSGHLLDTAPRDGTRISVKLRTLEETVQWCHWLDDWVVGTAPKLKSDPYELLAWEPTHWTKLIP
jgi:hypothetical protein